MAVASNMAQYRPKSVKDVSADDFIKAYSAHLKANDKVGSENKGIPQPHSDLSC